MFDAGHAVSILSKAEMNCLILTSLEGLLRDRGEGDLAGLVQAAHLNSSAVAEVCGDALEVEVWT